MPEEKESLKTLDRCSELIAECMRVFLSLQSTEFIKTLGIGCCIAVRYLPSLQPTEENFTARNWSMLLPGGIYLAFDQLSQEMPISNWT